MNKIGRTKYTSIKNIFFNKYLLSKVKISLSKIKRAGYKSILHGSILQRIKRIQKNKFKEKFSLWISSLYYRIKKIKEPFTSKKELSNSKTYFSFQENLDDIPPIIDVSWSFDKNIVNKDLSIYKENKSMFSSEHSLPKKLRTFDGKIPLMSQSLKPADEAFDIPFSLIEEPYYQVPAPLSLIEEPYYQVPAPLSLIEEPYYQVPAPLSLIEKPYYQVPPPPRPVIKSSQNFTQPVVFTSDDKSHYQNISSAFSTNLSFGNQSSFMPYISKNSLEKLTEKECECKSSKSKKNRRRTTLF